MVDIIQFFLEVVYEARLTARLVNGGDVRDARLAAEYPDHDKCR